MEVLIPLLVDDPLWGVSLFYSRLNVLVLIPLLVDDPLWVSDLALNRDAKIGLNPSFSG